MNKHNHKQINKHSTHSAFQKMKIGAADVQAKSTRTADRSSEFANASGCYGLKRAHVW